MKFDVRFFLVQALPQYLYIIPGWKWLFPGGMIFTLLYNKMHRLDYLRPLVWNSLLQFTSISYPIFIYRFCLSHKLSGTIYGYSLLWNSFQPKLSLISRRRLTYFITQIMNDFECILTNSKLLTYGLRLKYHLMFGLSKAD